MPTLREGWQGRFLEDFSAGDVHRCRYGRTITEADNIQFTLLTNNTHEIHFNREYGHKTEWGECLVNSLLTLSVAVGMGVMDVSQNGIALGWDHVRLTHSLFPGDTLYVENEVVGQAPIRVTAWARNREVRYPGIQPTRESRDPVLSVGDGMDSWKCAEPCQAPHTEGVAPTLMCRGTLKREPGRVQGKDETRAWVGKEPA
jgi:acyl dehydratase